VGMDRLAASYNWLPNAPPRFGVGLARQSGAETQPLGEPLWKKDTADLAYVDRTEHNDTISMPARKPPRVGFG